MKLLLDTCVWGGVKDELQIAGHDVLWMGDWNEDPGDEEILNCRTVLDRYSTQLLSGALITVERNRVRIRLPD